MTRNTTHHGWPVQEPGDTDYEDTFDSLVNQLDVDVVLRDTYANRPAAGTADRLFFAVDTHTIYYDDGTAWNAIGGFDTDGTDLVDGATVIWDTSAGHVPASSVQTLSLGGDTDTDLAGADLTDGTTTIWDATNGYVPESALQKTYAALAEHENVSGQWTFGASRTDFIRPNTTNGDRGGVVHIPSGGGRWILAPYDDANGALWGGEISYDFSANQWNVDTPLGLASDLVTTGGTTIWDATNGWVPEAILENNTVTVAGNTVSLGGSTTPTLDDFGAAADGNDVLFGSNDDFSWWFDGTGTSPADDLVLTADPTSTSPLEALRVTKAGDVDVVNGVLTEGGTQVTLNSRFPLPNSDLSNSSVTVAGNTVSLGGSVNPTLDDFAQAAGAVDLGKNYLTMVGDAGATFYLGGANTPDSTTSGVHLETGTNPTSGDPLFVVESSGGAERLRVEHSGAVRTDNTDYYASGNKVWHQGNDGEGSGLDADQWEGYDLQKNGTDGTGVINFKT